MVADMLERRLDAKPVDGLEAGEAVAITRSDGRQPWGTLAVTGYLARESAEASGAPVRMSAGLQPRNAALVNGVLSVRKSREARDKLTARVSDYH